MIILASHLSRQQTDPPRRRRFQRHVPVAASILAAIFVLPKLQLVAATLGSLEQPIGFQETVSSDQVIGAGAVLTLNGSVNFTGTVSVTGGTLQQLGTVVARAIPSTILQNSVQATSGTITLNHQTTFNQGLTLGAAATAATLTASGVGPVVFGQPVSLVNGTLSLVGATFGTDATTGAFTPTAGALNLNGNDVFNGLLTFSGGTFTEAGTQRATGVYGVRNTFGNGVTLTNVSASTALLRTLSGADKIVGDINVNAGSGTGTTDLTISNSLDFSGVANIFSSPTASARLLVGAGNGLGTGAGNAVTPKVNLSGDNAAFYLALGTVTSVNTNVNIGNAPTNYKGAIFGTSVANSILNGSVIFDNVTANNGTVGAGQPVFSIPTDGSLEIRGDLFNSSRNVGSGATRQVTTGSAFLSTSNSQLILSGQVKDIATGASTDARQALRVVFARNQELNIQVEKEWNATGMLTLAQGVLRYTGAGASTSNFFGSGVTSAAAAFEMSTFDTTSGGFGLDSSNIALLLTKPGQVFNADKFTVYNGNSYQAIPSLYTGYVSLGGENTSGTVTFGTGAGAITLATQTGGSAAQLRDLRLFAEAGGTSEIKYNFLKSGPGVRVSGGGGSISKIGNGSVILSGVSSGASSTLDQVFVLGGTLVLNSTSTAQLIGSSANLDLDGGTLQMNATGSGGTQTIGGNISMNRALSTVINGSFNGATLALGSGSSTFQAPFGVVRFATPNFGNITLQYSGAGSSSLPKGHFAYGTATSPTSDFAATNFAYVASGTYNITPYSGPGVDNVATFPTYSTVREVNGFTGSLAPNSSLTLISVHFAGSTATGPGVIDLGGGTSSLQVFEGILLASDATGANRQIVNGSLSAAANRLLMVQNWGGDGSSRPSLTIGARIINDPSDTSPTNLEIVGDGTTVLTNPLNSFTGFIGIYGGVLRLASDAPIASASEINFEGGTLSTTGPFAWSKPILIYGDRSAISVLPGTTFSFSSTFATREVGLPANYTGVNSFDGDLVIAGGGTFRQKVDSANGFTGQLFIRGGSRFVYEGNNPGFASSSYSWMDSTTVEAGSTLEINNTAALNVPEYFHLSGAGVGGSTSPTSGALEIRRPLTGSFSKTDRAVTFSGPIKLDGDTTIFVDDQPETMVAGALGSLIFNTLIFDGGGASNILTKKGNGLLHFSLNRTQNLPGIKVEAGELRFEGGMGTVGTASGSVNNNFGTGTSSIEVGTGSLLSFALQPRLTFLVAPGRHSADITLRGGQLVVLPLDAPAQGIAFAGNLVLVGPAATNGLEAGMSSSSSTRFNPTVFFGGWTGSGGVTKYGSDEVDLVSAGNTFTGELAIVRGGPSATVPSVGLYDTGRLTGVTSLRLTGDGSMHLDNRHNLDANTSNDNGLNRLNNTAEIHLAGAARLRLLGNTGAASAETVGALNLHRGSTAIELDPGTFLSSNTVVARQIGMTFASYVRDQGSVVNFRVLAAGLTFGTGAGNDNASIQLANLPATSLLAGNNGGVGALDRSVLIGAFGGVATKNFFSQPAFTTLPDSLNNNEQLYVGRHFLTIETVGSANYLRPLTETEYFVPTYVSANPNSVDAYVAINSGTNTNLRLAGGFGPFSTYVDDAAGSHQLTTSRRQDSLYRIASDRTFNTLSFAQTPTESVDLGGNRVVLELEPDKTLLLTSGMILHAAIGTLAETDPDPTHNLIQQAVLRGGALDAGSREIIVQNVAAEVKKIDGSWSNAALTGPAAFSSGVSDLAIYTSLTGSAGLTKSGASTVVLGGLNTYSGGTFITEGQLRLENSRALGSSSLVVVSGTGNLHLARGIELGASAAPHALQLRFTDLTAASELKSDRGNNAFYGDLQVDTTSRAGEHVYDLTVANASNSGLLLAGDVYGLNATTVDAGVTPLNDSLQRTGRTARSVFFTQTSGSVTKLLGTFRDTQAGAATSLVNTSNDAQVLRATISGANDGSFWVYQPWDAAGALFLRQGQLRLMPSASQFFSVAASNAINPFNAQARPALGDSAGDASLLLTTAGQVFNSPSLNIAITFQSPTAMIGGENESGTVKFMAPVGGAFNDAALRFSTWDRTVRLYAAPGGNVEVHGRVTDSGSSGAVNKIGLGSVIMKGMDGSTSGYVAGTSNNNDLHNRIYVSAGRLVLDYDVPNRTDVANLWGASTLGVFLNGGTLELRGDGDTASTAQSWVQLALRPGTSELILTPQNGKSLTATISSAFQVNSAGTITAGKNGGTVNFTLPSALAVIKLNGTLNSITTAAGFLAPWATFGVGAVNVDGTLGSAPSDFAALDSSKNVIAFAGYTAQNNPASFTSGAHINESTGFSSTTASATVKTIRFGANVASTLNLASGFTLGTGARDEGALLVPSGVTASKSITGGTLTVNGQKDLVVHNYGTGILTINSEIAGSGMNAVFTGNDASRTTLPGANTYTGATFLNGGTLSVSTLANGGLASALGASPAAPANLFLDHATLRYTGGSVTTDRGFTIGDGGATLDVASTPATVQFDGVVAAAATPSGSGGNPFAGGLAKKGPGTLVLTGANAFTGITDVLEGALAVGSNAALGSTNNLLDGTVVRSGATLRFAGASLLGEWISMKGGSTLEVSSATSPGLNGVITLEGRTNLTYTGASSGSAEVNLHAAAGYLTGSGTLVKGTVNNGSGGILSLNQSSFEWTGGLEIEGGQVTVRSLGEPLGTGTTPIQLGTAGVNNVATSLAQGSPQANLFLQPAAAVNVNGGATYSGDPESFPGVYAIRQDIVVNRPSSGAQLKQIGVLNGALSLDRYNLQGDVRLKDNLQFYAEDDYLRVNAGGEQVNINLNGHLVSETPATPTSGNLTARVSLTGRAANAPVGAYHDLTLVLSLNNSNPGFTGSVTIGNAVSDPDADYVLRLNHPQALSSANSIHLYDEATLQLAGHSVETGPLFFDGTMAAGPTQFAGPRQTTADIVSGPRAILENGAANPGTLFVHQTGKAIWPFLIRDGLLASLQPAGPLGLVLGGTGTVQIENANLYNGETTIESGATLVAHNLQGSATGTGDVVVQGGGTLAGDGSIAGALTVTGATSGRGVLSPGTLQGDGTSNPGQLALASVTFEGFTRLELDLPGGPAAGMTDRVIANSVTLNGEVELVLRLSSTRYAYGETVNFLGSGQAVAFGAGGAFTYEGLRLDNGSAFAAHYADGGEQQFQLVFAHQGADFNLVAVPELSPALLVAGAAALVVGGRRRARSLSASRASQARSRYNVAHEI